jgi:hypothetical protein
LTAISRGELFWRAPEPVGERIGALPDARVEQILAGLRSQPASFFGR